MFNLTLVNILSVLYFTQDYWDIGDPIFNCRFCNSNMCYEKRNRKDNKTRSPQFALCCMNGKVKLLFAIYFPKVLKDLLFRRDSRSAHFRNSIWIYNTMFEFTSMGGKIDKDVNNGHGPYVYHLSGLNLDGLIVCLNDQDLHNYIFMTQRTRFQIECQLQGILIMHIYLIVLKEFN